MERRVTIKKVNIHIVKEFLDVKKDKWEEKEGRELRLLHKEEEVWRFINKKKGRREWGENDISKNRWEVHFLETFWKE